MTSPLLILLGGSGYVGQAFQRELDRRGWRYRSVRRADLDYSSYTVLANALRDWKPDFLVNCAGFTGKPNVDACETQQADTLLGNVTLPLTIAHACAATGIPWGHVSSGCIYAGARIHHPDGSVTVEKDLTQPQMRQVVDSELRRQNFGQGNVPKAGLPGGTPGSPAGESPAATRTGPSHDDGDRILGFTEACTPNFSFRSPPCSFYSGSKALGEEVLAGAASTYLWRLRIPFDERDNARNYLSKVQRYSKVYDNANSISHLTDFARCSLDLWAIRAPFGTYNVTNPGFTTTRRVVELIQKHLKPARKFEFWSSDEEFYRVAAKTPRSNCVMDCSKLLAAGVSIRHVEEALEDALTRWVPEG